MPAPKYKRLENFVELSHAEMINKSEEFLQTISRRRTVREFSDKKIPLEVIENCIKAAATAPSGANLQPWHFVIVSDPKLKKEIRHAAEKEEKEFYAKRASEEWLKALEHLGTDENKPYLETASYLIVIFEQRYGLKENGEKFKHYYASESTGIAVGFLINAIHHAGLVSLTHTPSPMNFLQKILNRPENEKPYMILVVGLPADNVKVPVIEKKPFEKIATFL